ncbi:hypothetical protein [Natronogracilivirga saccharolytica]|uniref:DUF5683 domain-containing protein n=1 Tax=Natronogracilivirga saccharolytica TaxID=2812953 RepID=A0A8J7RRP3_9BACT|nr:hypothetical protein [Natronogracilivirga saccharolytica]MBP3192629.1 hypothetical protein [Natronogracilivirga saccharolytica]
MTFRFSAIASAGVCIWLMVLSGAVAYAAETAGETSSLSGQETTPSGLKTATLSGDHVTAAAGEADTRPGDSGWNNDNTGGEPPSQWGALLRSFIMPGWGHYYVDSDNWRRGQYHLGAEVALIAAYFGISRHANVIENNMYTHARAYSGVDIQKHGRAFELAVGSHLSLSAHNDFQERTRNLDRLFPDDPDYRWEWESDEKRQEYRDLRSRRDDLDQQLPTLGAIMVVNRVLSGISAFNRARDYVNTDASVYVAPGPERRGFRATLAIPF